MSYKALYRTYRPETFNDVVGQDHIVITLKNIIKNNKIAHAYLFTGPRGTGKTSVAHVFAREVNRTASGFIPETNLDIIEIDAASNNGVAEIRRIIDGTRYAPTNTKYKIYIIDEVHMLSKGAFNALLKTLEEPPEHVIFILATTEPHKIPVTILSRTQRFNFRRISSKEITKQLINILDKEEITYKEEAIKTIAKLSNGGMRDALTIADQTSAYSGGSVTIMALSQVLGIVSITKQINLINNIYKNNSKEVLKTISEVVENGADILRLTSTMLTILKDFIVFKKTADENLLELLTLQDIEQLNVSIKFAYKATEELINLIGILRLSQMPRQSFELAILKLTDNKNEILQTNNEDEKVDLLNNTSEILNEGDKETETNDLKDDNKIVEEKSGEDKEEEQVRKQQEDTKDKKKKSSKKIEKDPNTVSTYELQDFYDGIMEEKQRLDEAEGVSEDILSSQEFELNSVSKKELETKATSEIDLDEMFKPIDNEDDDIKSSESLRTTEIINLLQHADRPSLDIAKTKLIEVMAYASDPKYGTIVTAIDKMKPVAAGKKVLLFASEDNNAISIFNKKRKSHEMADLLKTIFGKSKEVYALTKERYFEVINNFKTLSANGDLPEKYKVKPPKPSPKAKDEEKDYATTLFGELFKEE